MLAFEIKNSFSKLYAKFNSFQVPRKKQKNCIPKESSKGLIEIRYLGTDQTKEPGDHNTLVASGSLKSRDPRESCDPGFLWSLRLIR